MSAHPSIEGPCRRPPEPAPREGAPPRRRGLAPRLARAAAASALLAIAALPACGAGDRAAAGDPGPAPAGGAAAIAGSADARARLDRLRALFPGALGEGAARGFEITGDRARPVFSPPPSPRVAAGALRVELPLRAAEPAVLLDGASQVGARVALEGASRAPIAAAGGVALYAGAAPGGADVVLRAHAGGLEDYVVLERRPAEEALRYDVELLGVAGLRLVANVLELLDAGGVPRIRVAPPYLVDAAGARHAAALSLEGCAADADPRPPWGRPVRPPGAGRCDLVVGWAGADVAYPALVDPAWSSTASPVLPRRRHTATRLASGAVLILGGLDASGAGQTVVELYDPISSTFSTVGAIAPRGGHTATYLGGLPERVLIAGGSPSELADAYAVASLYAVASGEVATGALSMGRVDHTATRLPSSGQVLVAGGRSGPNGALLATAELYDPTADGGAGAFTSAVPMIAARAAHVAAELPDGGVLIAGGLGEGLVLSSAERFDPAFASFSPIPGAMTAQRAFAAAAALEDGRVLITGGETSAALVISSADLFDPAADAGAGGFLQTATPMTLPRSHHQATPVPGAVLITGGYTGSGPSATAEFFDPAAVAPDPSFAPGTSMPSELLDHAATPLAGGGVLVTGAPLDPADPAGAVLSLQGLGLACASRFECASGVCAGDPGAGVCCNTPCSDLCRACTEDKTGAPSGQCQVVLDNTEVSQLCQNAFAFALTCVNGSVAAVDVQECAPFGCAGQVCAVACDASDQCADGAYCDPLDQQCKMQLQNGDPCSDGGQCPGGFCVDGVCCNAACEDACQACDVPGAAGACVVVSGAPRGGRSCAGGGTACAGVCDGQAIGCTYGSGPCGAAGCVDGAWTHGTCALGACQIASDPCTPYACGADGLACATSCAGSDACAEGFLCNGGACVDTLEVVCEGHTRRFRSGAQEDCPGGFTCADNGVECRKGCASVNECVAPLVCDASGACEPAPELPPLPDCAIGAAPGAPSPRPLLPWALALALAGACRRRRPRA